MAVILVINTLVIQVDTHMLAATLQIIPEAPSSTTTLFWLPCHTRSLNQSQLQFKQTQHSPPIPPTGNEHEQKND